VTVEERWQAVSSAREIHGVRYDLWAYGSPNWTLDAGVRFVPDGLLTGSVDAHPIIHVHAAVFTGFLVLPIGDMLLFGGFFIAGIRARRQREAHRRLMVLAAVALMEAESWLVIGRRIILALLPAGFQA
jgi:hypothetical protein